MNHPEHIHIEQEGIYRPHLIAWEVTRRCLLNCRHCRAAAQNTICPDEFSTDECKRLLDNIASFARPIIILTGGEPMLREDIYEIAAYSARTLQLPTVMAPCGLLLNDESARKIVDAGIRRISISLDGATAGTHDSFRGMAGSFEACLAGIAAVRRAGLEFQINTTISRHNVEQLEAILELSIRLGASVFNPFLLVPTGRGKQLVEQELSAEQYEQSLQWLVGHQGRSDIQIRVTCAPHYQRILRQCGGVGAAQASKGCMGGKSFAFISHVGMVQICGFMETPCGDIRKANCDFRSVWDNSEVFRQVRDVGSYHGRCGYCEFRKVCGGCRARALAISGDYLAEEPFCLYQPRRRSAVSPAEMPAPARRLDEMDKRLLEMLQEDFPITPSPFSALDSKLDLQAGQALLRTRRLVSDGIIRRIGAIFDSKRLGFVSTLAAGKVPSDRIDAVAAELNGLPSVTHNYQRDHAYNLWFTITCASQAELERTLAKLRQKTGIDFVSLPALAMYKARVTFAFNDEPGKKAAKRKLTSNASILADPSHSEEERPIVLDRSQVKLAAVLQGNMEPTDDMFDLIARQAGMDVQAVLAQLKNWLAVGVVRRYGAVLAHRKAGFAANGMAVFSIDQPRIDSVGSVLADYAKISHCYRRPTLSDWPYNLFAMVHGKTREEVLAFVERIARDHDLGSYQVLFSTREYKKASMRYFGGTA